MTTKTFNLVCASHYNAITKCHSNFHKFNKIVENQRIDIYYEL